MVAPLVLPEFDPRGGEAGARDRERIAELWDDTRDWKDARNRRLSDRVWLARQTTRDAIDQAIRRAIVQGTDPLILADQLERYLNPDLMPRRDADGRLIDGQAKRIVTLTPRAKSGAGPGLDGAGSYPARRLARTEISRAFAEATKQAARLNPFVEGLKWNLSARHPRTDRCNTWAERDNGMGRGVYPVNDFPSMPDHSHCLCYTTSVTPSDTDAVVDELRRAFRLDQGRPSNLLQFPVPDERQAAELGNGIDLLRLLFRVGNSLIGRAA